MAGWYLSEQARQAVRAARTLANERQHAALGPSHVLAAILRQWDDDRAGGAALVRACGLTAEQATDLTAKFVATHDAGEADTTAAEPRPNPALRFMLAHAYRIAGEVRAPYVGTEHMVLAALWTDYRGGLRRQGITYQQAADQLASLPRLERIVEDTAIEPLEAVAVSTPATAALSELARQQAEQHPVDGRVSTLHHLLALLMHGAARELLDELGVTYNLVRERFVTDGARLVRADAQRPDEGPLEGWARFDITPEQWSVIQPRVKVVLVDEGLWQQGVRFGMNFSEDKTRFWVSIHPGESGLTHHQVLDRFLGSAT